jgi:uncharacterized membrane protein
MNKIFEKAFEGEVGNILLLSLFIILSLITFVIVSYQINVGFANKITGIVFTNILVGRVPALSFGYAAELSHFVVIFVNVITEMILVTLIYPLFVYSFKGIVKIKILEDFFTEIKEKRKNYQSYFDKYGKLGLFIFVFIPFWMTGPIVGAIIGFLIGIKHYTVIVVVFIATIISITLWGLFLHQIINFLLTFNTQFVWLLLLIIVVALLLYRFKNKILKKGKNK